MIILSTVDTSRVSSRVGSIPVAEMRAKLRFLRDALPYSFLDAPCIIYVV